MRLLTIGARHLKTQTVVPDRESIYKSESRCTRYNTEILMQHSLIINATFQ